MPAKCRPRVAPEREHYLWIECLEFSLEQRVIRYAFLGRPKPVDTILDYIAEVEVVVELPSGDVLVPAIRERDEVVVRKRREESLGEIGVATGQPALSERPVDTNLLTYGTVACKRIMGPEFREMSLVEVSRILYQQHVIRIVSFPVVVERVRETPANLCLNGKACL